MRLFARLAAAAVIVGCTSTEPQRFMRPQTVVLFATPKMLPDFANPDAGVAQFLDHYMPLISKAHETIVIFSIGNSDHILNYQGKAQWNDWLEWARVTDGKPVSERPLHYRQIDSIVRSFKSRATDLGLSLKVYDQLDSGNEFTITNNFKYDRHPECIANEWESYDVRALLHADDSVYATAPNGIAEGTSCGTFLVDQLGAYLTDFGFDGILFDNQLGTRGRWGPGNGPGYSVAEAAGIKAFFDYSKQVLGDKEIMWFDSYNNVTVERETFSFPSESYASFDYLIASGFCVVTFPERYVDNLGSKLQLRDRTKVIATLDYVDPWYTYDSMIDYAAESANLEAVAIRYRYDIDGIVFFANDDDGSLVPRSVIESFAQRFFDTPTSQLITQ